MAYDIRLMKLINGEMVLGKYSGEDNKLKECALLQTMPTEQGVQMLLLPFGYPFEQDFDGEVSLDHVMYEYKSCPEDLKNKYLEATSKLTLSTPGDLQGLTGQGGNISQLFKK